MKANNIEINIIVEQEWKMSSMTVEKDLTIKGLKEKMNLPKGYELYYEWKQMPDCAIIDDWDCIEIKTDIEVVVDRLQHDFAFLLKTLSHNK